MVLLWNCQQPRFPLEKWQDERKPATSPRQGAIRQGCLCHDALDLRIYNAASTLHSLQLCRSDGTTAPEALHLASSGAINSYDGS